MERRLHEDIFLSAPTGAGKSVLFQVPAIHIAERYNLVTIVVSPLKALMLDQVTAPPLLVLSPTRIP
jgi:superfamily II DNA helicase RecQ